MKFLFRLITGLLTFAIGILLADWQVGTVQGEFDDRVYAVDVNRLVSTGDLFDGKMVQVRGRLTPFTDSNLANLDLVGAKWIETICVADNNTCAKIRARRSDSERSAWIGAPELDVEVVGRYRCDAMDQHPKARGGRVHLLEISDVISARPYCGPISNTVAHGNCGGSY